MSVLFYIVYDFIIIIIIIIIIQWWPRDLDLGIKKVSGDTLMPRLHQRNLLRATSCAQHATCCGQQASCCAQQVACYPQQVACYLHQVARCAQLVARNKLRWCKRGIICTASVSNMSQDVISSLDCNPRWYALTNSNKLNWPCNLELWHQNVYCLWHSMWSISSTTFEVCTTFRSDVMAHFLSEHCAALWSCRLTFNLNSGPLVTHLTLLSILGLPEFFFLELGARTRETNVYGQVDRRIAVCNAAP